MRERPSCAVELRCFGVWRWAVALVAATAMAAMAAWAGLALANHSSDSAAIAAVATALAGLSLWLAASLARVDGGTLACVDGCWTFAYKRRGVDRIEAGALAVALDLGSFLLLTLTRTAGPRRLARRWLPVQRRGLEADWHALRCAVYSPPPATPDAVAANELLTE
jgi:hypothetical protein